MEASKEETAGQGTESESKKKEAAASALDFFSQFDARAREDAARADKINRRLRIESAAAENSVDEDEALATTTEDDEAGSGGFAGDENYYQM